MITLSLNAEERQKQIVEKNKELVRLMTSADWKDRNNGEYLYIKEKVENLKIFLSRYVTNQLDFTPNCSVELLMEQLNAMTAYLNILEIRKQFEKF